MPSPINAKFTISSSTGLARLDNLVFSSTSSGSDISYLYDFGDNTTSISPTSTHIYPFPGVYTVSLTVADSGNNISTISDTVTINPYVEYGLYFKNPPASAELGSKSTRPFVIEVSASDTNDHFVELYSELSKSVPYSKDRNKWGRLKPEWRFEDTDGNVIERIKTTDSTIYASGIAVGTTGLASFYYIDDIGATSKCDYNLIWATLQTSGLEVVGDNELSGVPGYGNSKVQGVVPYFINSDVPSYLRITRDGDRNIYPTKWCKTKIPYVISVHGSTYAFCSAVGGPVPADSVPPILFDYPFTNVDGLSSGNQINRHIPQLPVSSLTFSPSIQNFIRLDDNEFEVGGVARGTVVAAVSSLNSSISASVRIQSPATRYRDTPYAWVSNPDNSTINRISFPLSLEECFSEPLSTMHGFIPPPKSSTEIYTVKTIENTNGMPFALSGFSGIYGIAVGPCGDPWVTDSEQDLITHFDTNGNVLTSIALTSISLDFSGCMPAGIALDGDRQFWVTLFDYVSVLKFDYDGRFLFAVAPDTPVVSKTEDFLHMPAAVDTDTNNNAYVTYASNLCSVIVKYDTTGVTVSTITQPDLSAVPVDIVVDGVDDSFWVVNAHSHIDMAGDVRKYALTGGSEAVLLSTYYYPSPSNITIDANQGVWVTYGFYNVAHIDKNSLETTFIVSAANITPVTVDPSWFDINSRIDQPSLEGIAADSKDRIWIINSVENMVYVVSAGTTAFNQSTFDTIKIYPDNKISWFNDNYTTSIYTLTSEWFKSAQAFGDWTGYRWIQKYIPYRPDGEYIVKTIHGSSNTFDIKQFNTHMRKHNESFDLPGQIEDYAMSHHIKQNTNLFNNVIGKSVDSPHDTHQSLGRQIVEKISNFTDNNQNIDTCNIDQLYSIAEQLNVPIDDYDIQYPSELKRLMDIFSINHNQLWGGRCQCNRNFTDDSPCAICNNEHSTNLGAEFNTNTYTITAGVSFVVKDNFKKNLYELMYAPVSGSATQYPLSTVDSISWLSSTDFDKYTFYTHDPTPCNTLLEGVINWDDALTTLSETNSSIDNWYKDTGAVEEIINYELHKGLDLIED